MMEQIELGATPANEKCAQVGSENYYERAQAECGAYKRQLLRLYKAKFGEDLPDGCGLKISANPHDFGTYHEVAIRYNEEYEPAVEAAFWFDANVPSNWDSEAIQELEEVIPGFRLVG